MSALVLGPSALALAYVGGWAFDVAIAAAASLGLAEWLRLTGARPIAPFLAALALVMLVWWVSGAGAALGALALLTAVLAAVYRRGFGQPLFSACGLPYLALTALALAWLRAHGSSGWPLVAFVFLIVWATDIGAFLVGRRLGGPRLAPAISPNKTWAGFVGGLVFAGAASIGWAWGFTGRPGDSWGLAVVVAIMLSLVGQAGDLFESAIKRRFGVKDSGGLIPGHGGVLDRIDALLFVAPVFAFLYELGLTAGMVQ